MANGTILTDQLGHTFSFLVNSDGSLSVTPASGITPSTADNSVSITALNLIASALRLINAVASGEPVDLSMANDSLMVLQHMIDSWNADGLTIYSTRIDDYPLTIGQQAYTVGNGGDFNTNRPARIMGMSTIVLTNPAVPIEVPITMYSDSDWQGLPVKAVNSSFPQVCYDDGGFPLRTLYMWPIPTQVNNVRIYSWQPLIWPTTLQTSLHFPPGYAEAFRYNLAVRLSPEFQAPLLPAVQQIAVESLARVKTMNSPDLSLRSDLAASQWDYNYRADMFGIPF